jgi:hypothetical protein
MGDLVQPQTLLGLVFFAALFAGLLGSLAALLTPYALRREHRHRYWLLATAGFLVAGALGILSIGVVFVAAAGVTGLAATRAAASRDEPDP